MLIMASPIEIVIGKLNIPLSKDNRRIIKQIKDYENKRDAIRRAEHGIRLLAKQVEDESLSKTAEVLVGEADRLSEEMDRLTHLIDSLIDKLQPDK